MKILLRLTAATTLAISTVSAQDDPVAAELTKYKAALAASDSNRLAQETALKSKYEAALNRLKAPLNPASEIEALLAIAAEIQSLKGGQQPQGAGKPSEALLAARATYLEQLAMIQSTADSSRVAATESAIGALRTLTGQLAAADKLDAALAAERERKTLEADSAYLTSKRRLAAAPPATPDQEASDLSMAMPRHGLHSYYPFDGRLENTQGDGTVKVIGDRRYAGGRVGRSLHLENVHGRAKTWMEFALPRAGAGNFSVSFCARIDAGPHASNNLFSIGKTDDTARFYLTHQQRGEDSGYLVYSLGRGNYRDASAKPPKPEPRWGHFAITVESETISYYVNGSLAATMKPPTEGYDFSDMVGIVGTMRRFRNNDAGEQELIAERGPDMLIDELAVYSRALSSGEVRAIAKNYKLFETK